MFGLESGVLVGRDGVANVEVVRIEILPGATASGADVTYSYQVTLSQPVEHVDDNIENSALLSGVQFQATDDEGDVITGSISVTIVDDVPTANADATPTAEDTAVTFNVIANDDAGCRCACDADSGFGCACRLAALGSWRTATSRSRLRTGSRALR